MFGSRPGFLEIEPQVRTCKAAEKKEFNIGRMQAMQNSIFLIATW